MTELEFDAAVARLLDRYAWPPRRESDWSDVLRRAELERPRRGHRHGLVAVAAALAALVALTLATPLGGALRRSVADFTDWLAGTPGAPVSEEEQQAFEEANRRQWTSFPGSPELRRLLQVDADGVQYDLLGFRSGNSLCLRLVARGEARGSTLLCAPVTDLRHDDVPVRVLFADSPFGRGEKRRTIGFTEYRSARAQVTAGIVADGVRTVELVDTDGAHEVPVRSNAFLYVAERPDVGQRVTHVRAKLADGRTVGVPFAVSPHGAGSGYAGLPGEPGGPAVVERVVDGATIGWVLRRERRGVELDDELKERIHFFGDVEYGRVITPDPGSSKRIAITLDRGNGGRLGAGGPGIGYSVLAGGSASGSRVDLDNPFPRAPFTFSYGTMGAGDQYATFAGLASDDVARLEIFTASGHRLEVPLKDNAYLAEVALARFPAKLVAYDRQGRVIGIESTFRDEGPFTVHGPPILTLKESHRGTTLELRANRTLEGGECAYLKGTGRDRRNSSACTPEDWTHAPLRVGIHGNPPIFLYGRAREDIVRVELRYRDGRVVAIQPGARGYVLEPLPLDTTERSPIREIVGLDAEERVVARERMPVAPRPPVAGPTPRKGTGPVRPAESKAVIDDWFADGDFDQRHRCPAIRTAIDQLPSRASMNAARKHLLAYVQRMC
jgi:hypothetical protein